MTSTQVAIVGGGLAGLYAARLLRAANVEFVIVEARDRLGGRILTVDESGRPADDGFDLGPSWYWPHVQPAIAAIVAELGLQSFAQNSEGDVMFERMSREGPQRYAPVNQEILSYRVAGGTGALVRALSRDFHSHQLMRGAEVTAMTLTAAGFGEGQGPHVVDLAIRRSDGMVEHLFAEHVIATVPPRLLEATVKFSPALDAPTAARWRATPTWMAPHAKFFAIYDQPFWRHAGLSGSAQSMVGPMPEIHDATTATGQAALFGFLGIGAEQRDAMGEQALTRACLEQLARTFGENALHPRATLFKDWAVDRWTATNVDRSDGSHPTPGSAAWVTGAWKDFLVLGGSETSQSEPGYLAGAVAAASEAVAATLFVRQRGAE
jgi:monoamine oxidase